MAVALFVVVVAVRSIDIFVLRLDQLPDNVIVSRALGFLLVLGYLQLLRKPIGSIGLHAKNFAEAFLIGALSLIFLYAALYAIQFYLLRAGGETPRLVFGAIDEETRSVAGLFFTFVYLFGQIVNVLMEEGIFRGLMLPLFMRRFRFWQANALQAFLFGVAHLVFPLHSWVSSQATSGDAAVEAASLLVFTTIGGLVFGYVYYRTDSLWTATFAHFIDSVVGLFFHIQTVSRLNAETDVLIVARIGFLALLILTWAVATRSNLPTLKPWREGGDLAEIT